jgi:hypothetical protein
MAPLNTISPPRDPTHCVDQLIRRRLLHEIALRASAQNALRMQGFVEHGKHQNGHTAAGFAHTQNQVQARLLPPERQVEHDHVGAILSHLVQRRGNRVGLAGDDAAGHGPEQVHDAPTHDWMVIND